MNRFLSLSFALCLLVSAAAQLKKDESYMLVGTYTSGKASGIYVYKFNSYTGKADSVSMIKSENPSFLAVSPNQRFVYAVNENANNGNGGTVSAYSFNKKTGQLIFINQQPSGGDHPCYVTVDKTGKWVIAGNYSSGSLSVLPVAADGGLLPPDTVIRHVGNSINEQRQKSPHVHCTLLSDDNRNLFVPDLGMDKVMIYEFDEKKGSLKPTEQAYVASIPGSGPRHFTIHPNNKFAYLIEEMSGTVVAYQYNNGNLRAMQRVTTVQKTDTGFIGSADIHVSNDGRFLYASNRGGNNTIAIFKIDSVTGKLSLAGHQPTKGSFPRSFSLDPSGEFLLAANQHSDMIAVFVLNKRTGLPLDTGTRIKVGNPVCIKWIR